MDAKRRKNEMTGGQMAILVVCDTLKVDEERDGHFPAEKVIEILSERVFVMNVVGGR